MRYGIEMTNLGDYADPTFVTRLAHAAEAAGWEGLFVCCSPAGTPRSQPSRTRRRRSPCPAEAVYPEDEVPEEMESYVTKATEFDYSGVEPG